MSHAQQAQNPGTCFIRAYAKINLTLDVLGRRTDGYHELATIMQTIDLYDTICLTATDDEEIQISCSQPELSTPDNLVVRAAQLVRQRLGIQRGVLIELHKRIPMAAGLGGGSSDAAALLLALKTWWQLPLTSSDLSDMAAALGSDVPFFLNGGLALCEGRGERITPLTAHWPHSWRWLVLLKPPIAVSTATVFRDLPASDYSDGSHSQAIVHALAEQAALAPHHLYNGLEHSILAHYPVVVKARDALLEAGASLVRLSGSGPTLFAPCGELSLAVTVQEKVQAAGYEAYLSRAIYPTVGDIC
jgi:4-diphosphocytidyl-2-C-methyl-D-erythritol kinase